MWIFDFLWKKPQNSESSKIIINGNQAPISIEPKHVESINKKDEKKSDDTFPVFKYHTTPLETGVIKPGEIICDTCCQKRDYFYDSTIYWSMTSGDEKICPWCIADWKAAEELECSFVPGEEMIDSEKFKELTERTPGYVSWQGERWLTHCNDYCIFQKYVGFDDIIDIQDQLKDDLMVIQKNYNLKLEDLKSRLVNDGVMQWYLFKCLHCEQHRLHIDMN